MAGACTHYYWVAGTLLGGWCRYTGKKHRTAGEDKYLEHIPTEIIPATELKSWGYNETMGRTFSKLCAVPFLKILFRTCRVAPIIPHPLDVFNLLTLVCFAVQ